MARWRLLPSPAALLATGRIRGRGQAPLFYATRPFRSVLFKLYRRFGGERVPEGLRLPPQPESSP